MALRYRTWFSAACLTLALAGYTQLSERGVHPTEPIATSPQTAAQSLSQTPSNSYSIASSVASMPWSQNSIASTAADSAYLEQTIKLLTLVKGWIKDGNH